jgi:hypothetical protein
MRILLAAALCLAAAPAFAQFRDCSQTVGTAAAPVAFANRTPTVYLEICNAHATNTLGVNVVGGTAAVGAQGTRTLTAGLCWAWKKPEPIPITVSLIGSATSTTTACQYQ